MSRPRLLHLIDPNLGSQAERQQESIQRGLKNEFDIQTHPLGSDASTLRMPRIVAALRRRLGNGFLIIHAFGNRAMTVAAMAFAGPILYSPADESPRSSAKWVRAVNQYRNVHVVCSSGAERNFYINGGVPPDRCHLIHPSVDFSRIRKQRDQPLRSQLGFTEEDRILLLAGESGTFSGHAEALWAAAILHVLDPHYKVLAWGRGNQIGRLRHFAESQKHVGFFTVAESRLQRSLTFEELLPASDLILVTPIGPAPSLPICIAMASGLPIVGTASSIVGEFVEDRHTALLTKPGSPKLLAQRILDLQADAALARKIGDQARGEAYQYFSISQQMEKFSELYRQFTHADQPVMAGI
jgi:glycosyltransferase involved in cell wall biosynthesis